MRRWKYAAPFFAMPRHAGGEAWAWQLTPAPEPRPSEAPQDHTARLATFYRDRMAEILLGPPEDIGKLGAVARGLRRP